MTAPDVDAPGEVGTDDRAQEQNQTDTAIVAHAAVLRKALATLTAKLALRGYELHQMADSSLLISRWNLSRPLADLDAARKFAERVGSI